MERWGSDGAPCTASQAHLPRPPTAPRNRDWPAPPPPLGGDPGQSPHPRPAPFSSSRQSPPLHGALVFFPLLSLTAAPSPNLSPRARSRAPEDPARLAPRRCGAPDLPQLAFAPLPPNRRAPDRAASSPSATPPSSLAVPPPQPNQAISGDVKKGGAHRKMKGAKLPAAGQASR